MSQSGRGRTDVGASTDSGVTWPCERWHQKCGSAGHCQEDRWKGAAGGLPAMPALASVRESVAEDGRDPRQNN